MFQFLGLGVIDVPIMGLVFFGAGVCVPILGLVYFIVLVFWFSGSLVLLFPCIISSVF